ncbi:hypothetical protein GcM1_205023 [Golovinomyces cichoracearum]|uniref:Uncharacterized protein n=1 Tax=Golovinomyces cichoracearum TaxID=62708 RepID=A0A420IX33_9PEZI|nr:hypothetical protein GcM1_205023 [Golovinomyces cichoracearum]
MTQIYNNTFPQTYDNEKGRSQFNSENDVIEPNFKDIDPAVTEGTEPMLYEPKPFSFNQKISLMPQNQRQATEDYYRECNPSIFPQRIAPTNINSSQVPVPRRLISAPKIETINNYSQTAQGRQYYDP